jgi:hypothetical protein
MSSAPGTGGASAFGTRGGDTIGSSNEPDYFQYCQSFPASLDQFAVTRMHGLSDQALRLFYEITKTDGDVDEHGRPLLRRERLKALAANALLFALVCQRPAHEVAELCAQFPHLVDEGDARGHTPLHLAVLNGDAATVKVLLECGAPVNATTAVQNTALHLAYDRPDMAELLLEHGALPEAINKWQKTVMDWCNATANSATGPTGKVRAMVEAAEADAPQMIKRAKAQQLRMEARRKTVAAKKKEHDDSTAANEGAAEAWLEEQTAAKAAAEDWATGGADVVASSLGQLASSRGPAFAKELFGAVKAAKGKEVAASRKETTATQRKMAELRSDRGLKFETFVSGQHGARELDYDGQARHRKARERFLEVREAPGIQIYMSQNEREEER